eukprot:gi/632987964/ref/XP_007882848.1/ PREDICTED: ATP-binding cassette sub-family F member 3-like [Callorhinchus milii]
MTKENGQCVQQYLDFLSFRKCMLFYAGVLDSSASDFESVDEIFEAIGDVLQEISDSKNEDNVREICQRMFNTLKLNTSNSSKPTLLLKTPIQLSKMSSHSDYKTEEIRGIWMTKRDTGTTVDAKKLEKAEARLRAKQEKRTEKGSQKIVSPVVLEEASASQASSKKESRLEASGKNKSYDIKIENFDVSYGERTLLTGAEVHLAYGRRYGLVGRNGLGKTTLLKMMSARNLHIPSHISVLHVEQEVAGDDTRALQSVLQCDVVRESLLQEEKELNVKLNSGLNDGTESTRLTEIYAKLEEIEADKAPARASVILAGLGFSPRMQQQMTREFSGGWRMRLALARALFGK